MAKKSRRFRHTGRILCVTANPLHVPVSLPITAHNGGLFISSGVGRHPERVIDSYEMIYVQQGTLGMFEEEQRFEVRAGETLLLWPGRKHGGTLAYPAELRFYWIHFSLPTVANHGGETLTISQHVTPSRPDRLEQLFRLFLDEQEAATITPLAGSCYVMLMLNELVRQEQAPGYGQGAAVMLAQQAEQYICVHFAESISSTVIADTLSCHPDYLGRVFKTVYGVTLTEAIHRRRIRRSRSLLLDGTLPLEAVAQACGFEDIGYFRRIFRRYEGLSPRAYRLLYARVHLNTE
ncbi:MAG: helix-turn-helix transcriptional regulator [Armatimonadota bacterium]